MIVLEAVRRTTQVALSRLLFSTASAVKVLRVEADTSDIVSISAQIK